MNREYQNQSKKASMELANATLSMKPAFRLDADDSPATFHCGWVKLYARYIDKTQVHYLLENDRIAHRVLQVQQVSKIGSAIGHALCYDLGHSEQVQHVPPPTDTLWQVPPLEMHRLELTKK